MKEPSVIDNSTARFEQDLFNRVDTICKQVFGEVGCPPAPPLGSPYWSSGTYRGFHGAGQVPPLESTNSSSGKQNVWNYC